MWDIASVKTFVTETYREPLDVKSHTYEKIRRVPTIIIPRSHSRSESEVKIVARFLVNREQRPKIKLDGSIIIPSKFVL